ncbi:MAG: YybH family protein, partial [Terriglobales bacterium]
MIARIAVFLLMACAAFAQSQPSAQPVLDADRAFNQATQQNRLEGWMSYMADNVVLFGQNPPVVGKDAVRKFYEPQFTNPDFTLTWEPKTAEMQPSERVGHTSGRWTMRMKNSKGDPVELHGTYLTVWGKQKDGSWKVIADGGSSDPR